MSEQDSVHVSAFSLADLNTTIDQEPRILDLRLAVGLGFKTPLMIRKLIQRHLDALERLGGVLSIVEKTSASGGRPGKGYWLTKRQAVYIVTKAETDRATDITIAVVELFDAAVSGATLGLSPGEADLLARLRGMAPAQLGQLLALTNSAGAGGGDAASGARQTDARPEPPFCAGCAARFDWFDRPALQERAAARSCDQATDDDIRSLPFLSGPLTHLELGIIVAYRFAVRAGQTDRNLDTLRAVAQALGVSAPPQDTRRLPPTKGGTR